ncbi:hypothetical protein BR93DRAFT_60999 [Coniochaeta sp. PMI_546]|nr:hypothetical protein BR93DRAFT_60999 [Coniochaeta sp. PMI_546]
MSLMVSPIAKPLLTYMDRTTYFMLRQPEMAQVPLYHRLYPRGVRTAIDCSFILCRQPLTKGSSTCPSHAPFHASSFRHIRLDLLQNCPPLVDTAGVKGKKKKKENVETRQKPTTKKPLLSRNAKFPQDERNPLTSNMHEETKASTCCKVQGRGSIFVLAGLFFQDKRGPRHPDEHGQEQHGRAGKNRADKTKQTPVSQPPILTFEKQCEDRILVFLLQDQQKAQTSRGNRKLCTGIHEQGTKLFLHHTLQQYPPLLILF